MAMNILNMIIKWFDQQFEQPPIEKNVNTRVRMLTFTYLCEETKKSNIFATFRNIGGLVVSRYASYKKQ
ncbi:hypothetical protein ACT6P6_06800 [Priestia endophytica]